MPAPANSTEFLDFLRRSGVVDEKRLDAWVQKTQAGGVIPPEATKLATLMVREGLLTRGQGGEPRGGRGPRAAGGGQ